MGPGKGLRAPEAGAPAIPSAVPAVPGPEDDAPTEPWGGVGEEGDTQDETAAPAAAAPTTPEPSPAAAAQPPEADTPYKAYMARVIANQNRDSETTCFICGAELSVKPCTTLPCRPKEHTFHIECINHWVNVGNVPWEQACPYRCWAVGELQFPPNADEAEDPEYQSAVEQSRRDYLARAGPCYLTCESLT